MNNDLISREALKEAFKSWKTMDDYYHDTDCKDIPLSEVFDLIDNAPTVEVGYLTNCANCERVEKIRAKRSQGEWVVDMTTREVVCSCCRQSRRDTRTTHIFFCNHCGAYMKGGTNAEDDLHHPGP